MDSLIQDLRYAVRSCLKQKKIAIIIIFTLAVGIGATAALFTVVNAVLLRSLRYKDSDRLVRIYESNLRKDSALFSVSPPNYLDWKQENRVLEEMATLSMMQDFNLVRGNQPEQVSATRVSSNLFPLLNVNPKFGRRFLPEDEQPNKEPVAILGYGVWERLLGKDEGVIGQTISLNGEKHTVIGIMPADFELPFNNGQIYLPLRFSNQDSIRARRYLRVIARVKAGVSLPQVQADLTAIAQRLERQYQDSNAGWGVAVKDLKSVVVPDDFRESLWLLLGAVGMVLLISCVNVANLFSAQASSRQKELAIRAALGATRIRLIRQLLIESAILSILGGLLGLLISYLGVRLLLAVNPEDIPRLSEIQIDWAVLIFTFLISLMTAAIFGTFPALQASKVNLNSTLKEVSRGATAGPNRRRAHNLLMISEVALALVVMIGAGLLVKSFRQLQQVAPGFDPSQVLAVKINLPESKYPKREAIESFFKEISSRLSALPGVTSVGTTNIVPMGPGNSMNAFTIVGRPQGPGESEAAAYRTVSPGFFSTLRISVLMGRLFEERETRETARVMVIDESMQRRFWPNENPLGKEIKFGGPDEPPYSIVGVVRDVKRSGLDKEVLPTMYLSSLQARPQPYTTVLIRTAGDPLSLVPNIRREIQSLDREQALASAETMEQIVSLSLAGRRFNLVIFSIFAVIGMVLAAVGIYCVIAHAVHQRTHELGVRLALGAQRLDIMLIVLKQGLALAVIGIGVGLMASFAMTRVMSNMLFQVSPINLLVFVVSALLSLIIAQLACLIPARRAMTVDPLTAIREE